MFLFVRFIIKQMGISQWRSVSAELRHAVIHNLRLC